MKLSISKFFFLFILSLLVYACTLETNNDQPSPRIIDPPTEVYFRINSYDVRGDFSTLNREDEFGFSFLLKDESLIKSASCYIRFNGQDSLTRYFETITDGQDDEFSVNYSWSDAENFSLSQRDSLGENKTYWTQPGDELELVVIAINSANKFYNRRYKILFK